MPVAPALPAAIQPLSPTDPPSDGFEPLVCRVRSEYLEWPRLRLSLAQACRLWTADADLCRRVLQQLVEEGLVTESDQGVYSARTAP